MPIHRIQGPDGKIHRIEAPANADPAALTRFVASQVGQEEPGFFDIAQSYTTDVPVRAIKGALGGVEAITNVFGADNPVSEFLEGAQEGINEYLVSDTAKRRAAEREQTLEGKGFLDTLKEVPGIIFEDPALIFEVLGSAAPAVAATALTGGAGAIAGGAAALGTGAAMGVGATKESIYDATKEEFLKAGVDEKAAAAAADEAQSYLGENMDMIALGGALGALASRTGLEPTAARMIAGRVVGKSISQSAGREAIEQALTRAAEKGAIRTGLTEAATEGAQGAQSALAGNLARSREGFDVDVMEGVGQAAALEGTLGGIAGAGVGVLGKRDAALQALQDEEAVETQERAARPVFGAPEEFNRDNVTNALQSAAGEAPYAARYEIGRVVKKLNNDINTGTPEAIAESEQYIQQMRDRIDAGEVRDNEIDPLQRVLDTAKDIVGQYKTNVLGVEPTPEPEPSVEEAAPVAPTAVWENEGFEYNVEVLPDEPVKGPEGKMFQRVSYEGEAIDVPVENLRFEQATPPPTASVQAEAGETPNTFRTATTINGQTEIAEGVTRPTIQPEIEPTPVQPATQPEAKPIPALEVKSMPEFKAASNAWVKFSNAFENAGPIRDFFKKAVGMDVLPDELDIEKSFGAVKARQSGLSRMLEREHVTPLINTIKNSGVNLQDLGMYLLARAAPARNALVRERNPDFPEAGSSIDDAEATEMLADLGARGLLPKLERVARQHDKLVDAMLDQRVKAGIMTAEEAVALRRAEPFYTPFKGFSPEGDLTGDIQEDKNAQVEKVRQVKGNMRVKEFMQARGRESLPFHPLFNLFSDAESLSRRVAQNEVLNTVLNMREAQPEVMGDFIKGVYTDKSPKTERFQGQTVPVDMARAARDNPNQYFVAKRGGETQFIEFNTNTDGGRAMQEMFTSLTPEQMGRAMEVWSAINNGMKALLTYRNPLYLAAMAPLRDITDAVATAFSSQNIKGSPAFKKNIAGNVMKYVVSPSMLRTVRRFVVDREPVPGNEDLMAMLEQMVADGGAPMQQLFSAAEERASEAQKELQRLARAQRGDPTAKLMNAGAALGSALDAWADFNDLIPRFATYRAALDAGLSRSDAAALALDSSLNLTKRGTATRWMDNLIPFFSAGVEGTRKFIRIVRNPRSMAKVGGSLIALGIIESLLNAGLTDDENEDGTPDYLDVSKGTRMSRLVLFYGSGGDDHVDIPIGHMLGYLKYVGNQIADVALGVSSGEAASAAIAGATFDLGTGLFSLVSPARVQGGDLTTVLASLAPLGIKPFVEAANNKNFFGTPIYTEHRETSGPASELGRNNTAELWKSLARAINEISGGGPATSGYADLQPEVYEHVIDGLLGGAYDLISQTYKLTQEPELKNVPVIRGFAGKGFDYVPQTKYKENTKVLQQWKSRVDNISPEQMQREMAKKPIDADPRVLEAYGVVDKELSRLSRERAELLKQAKGEPDHETLKKAVEDYYRAKMNEQQNAFNYLYDAVRKENENQ